ncbi:MAG: hemolysin D [Pirellulales bacterium]
MADSLVNSAMRPLKLRKRPDLEARRHRYHGRSYWVVKEPVGLNYFRFHEEEFAILNMLDGKNSLQAIRDAFQSQFAPQRITLQDLQQFVGMLHRSGLVISHASGQGRQLRRRGDEKKKKELLGKFANVFALRFRGIDPERLLNGLLPWFGWLFTTWALCLFLMFGLAAGTLVLVNFQEFRAKLPTFEQFFAAHNWIYLGITMATVKVLHEFGHGLSCKKFGGECHEMGFMLLVFTPCLYCNVSDSWMLPNKWQRVFIGAAGMYVELILASIATFLWWFSVPGMFNFLCLSVMFICSVSTVMFNGNPLLRFDGYYILMDILEIPNLRQKSTEVVKRWFQSICLGLELQENPFLPQRNQFWFGAYTVAAVIYRWVVVVGIVLFLNAVLKPYGLQVLGRLFAITGFGGLIAAPLWSTIKFFRTPGRAAKMKKPRVAITAAVAAAAIGLVAFVPLPFWVHCAVEIQPIDGFQVRTMVPGYLVAFHKRPGDLVNQGDVIATLDNVELRAEIVKAKGELDVAKAQLDFLQIQARRDPSAVEIPAQVALVNAKQSIYDKLVERMQQLKVVSGAQGIVVEPPSKEAPKGQGAADQLPTWTGSPFAIENTNAYFAESDLICLVGRQNPASVGAKGIQDQMEAVIIIDQGEIELIDEGGKGDDVYIMLDAAPLSTLHGLLRRENISKTELKEVPPNLSLQSGGRLDTKMDADGKLKPISTSYQARISLDDHEIPLRAGYRGQAKIYLGWKSLGWRLKRIVMKTFNFEF